MHAAVSIHLDGHGLVLAAIAVLAAGCLGYLLHWWQHRWWRIRGFRYLIAMSEMYQQFTVGDVFVAFDPSCAAERRRLSEYRRRVSDDDSVAGLHSAPSRTEA